MEKETKSEEFRSTKFVITHWDKEGFWQNPYNGDVVKRHIPERLEERLIELFFQGKEDLVRNFLNNALVDASRFKVPEGGLWTDEGSPYLSSKQKLRDVLKQNHDLSDGKIYKLLESYK